MTFAALWAALISWVGPTAAILSPITAIAPSSMTRRFGSTVITVAFSIRRSANFSPFRVPEVICDSRLPYQFCVGEVLVITRGTLEQVGDIRGTEYVWLQIGKYRQYWHVAPDGLLNLIVNLLSAGKIRLVALRVK